MKVINVDNLESTCAELDALLCKHGSWAAVVGGNVSRTCVRFDLDDTAPQGAVDELAEITGYPVTRGHGTVTVWKDRQIR